MATDFASLLAGLSHVGAPSGVPFAPSAPNVLPPTIPFAPIPTRNSVQAAVAQFLALRNLGLHSAVSLGAEPYKLEFWDKADPGSVKEPRPDSIPLGAIGVELFNKHVKPISVLADVASHYMIHTDPTMKRYYQQFLKSVTPEQLARTHTDYKWAQKNLGETRPYAEWLQKTRLPAYFRGYTFGQWPEDFTSRVFNKQQIELFDQVRKYLGVTQQQLK